MLFNRALTKVKIPAWCWAIYIRIIMEIHPEVLVFANGHLIIHLDRDELELFAPVMGGQGYLHLKRHAEELSVIHQKPLGRYLLSSLVLQSEFSPPPNQLISLQGVLWRRQAALLVDRDISSYHQALSQMP